MYINPNNALHSHPLAQQSMRILKGAGKIERVNKGELILTEGRQCDFLFYVENGAFRAFRWIGDREVTIGFSFTGDFDTCPYAFINNQPSTDVIEALCDSLIIRVYKTDLEILEKQYPDLRYFISFLLSHYVEILVNRMIEQRILTAEENYINLLSRQAGEVTSIPLQYIASYLGISKERLSRIRKKLRS